MIVAPARRRDLDVVELAARGRCADCGCAIPVDLNVCDPCHRDELKLGADTTERWNRDQDHPC